MAATALLSHVAPHKWFLAIPDWGRGGGGAILTSIGLSGFLLVLFCSRAFIHVQHYDQVSRWYSLLTGIIHRFLLHTYMSDFSL